MIKIIRTNFVNQDFIELVKYLDIERAQADGDDHSYYAQFNKIDKIKHVVLAYENDKPVACGAMIEFNTNTMEIKRMFTIPAERGKGIAAKVLAELESWATELCYEKCILETAKRLSHAIALYEKSGYYHVPNYGQYSEMENSVCFQKELCN